MSALRIQLVCLMLLAFTCSGMCTDSEEEMKALEADVLSNMYSSKVLQQDYLDPNSEASDKEEIVKRKVPYILKRQTHVSKARRPYILKRGSYY
uniref:Neurotensin/neuromedin N n=1 Tax=Leptobrachium leishanense TaxID=445787 RepID=A0A8C5QNE6_9ANUR